MTFKEKQLWELEARLGRVMYYLKNGYSTATRWEQKERYEKEIARLKKEIEDEGIQI